MRWRLYIEEYSPDLMYIKGDNNVVADALSRLDMGETQNPKEALIIEEMQSERYCYAKEEMNYDSHPLSFQQMEKAQQADKLLVKTLNSDNLPDQNYSFHGGRGE